MEFQQVCKQLITFLIKDRASRKINSNLSLQSRVSNQKFQNKIVKDKVWKLISGKINQTLEVQIQWRISHRHQTIYFTT